MNKFDLLIVGAGPVGCTIAQQAAALRGWSSLIVEKRDHIGGNCHDAHDSHGILVHKYGPHYFRTNNDELFNYLSAFTQWLPGEYYVKSFSRGEFFPFPINLSTLEQFFNKQLTPEKAQAILNSKAEKFLTPVNSEEFVLSRVGRELYEAFYLGYTLKQWETHPRDLAPSVCGRIPVRLNRDARYVDHKYQVIPDKGYTAMFARMISDPRIHIMLKTDYNLVREWIRPRIATVYCGPVDDYFGHRHGKLGWRSLKFEFVHYETEFKQSCVQINYPNDFAYTRSVEIKHVTKQRHPHTAIAYEYPQKSGDPYYPLPTMESDRLFKKYQSEMEKEEAEKDIFFSGRLAQYRYINMDEAFEMALGTFRKILRVKTNG